MERLELVIWPCNAPSV